MSTETKTDPGNMPKDIRKALIVELTAANGDEKWSTDMVNRIERGALRLPRIHAQRAHELAAALVKRPSA